MIVKKPADPANYGGKRLPVKIVVVHVESGSEEGTIRWFQNPKAHVSAHYSVSKAGQVYSHVDEDKVAWHAGIKAPCVWNNQAKNKWPGINPNSYSIGIENEGFDDGKPWSRAQLESLAGLIADVCKRHSIPATRDFIVGHHEIYAGHTCPGKACPLDDIVQAVQEKLV